MSSSKKLTAGQLKKRGAPSRFVLWFQDQKKSELRDVILSLLDENHFGWANWLLARHLPFDDKIRYARLAADEAAALDKTSGSRASYQDHAESVARNVTQSSDSAEAAALSAVESAAFFSADAERTLKKKIILFGLDLLGREKPTAH